MGDDDWQPQRGELINGAFRVVRTLGEGGMGLVVLAHDLALDREVALKFVKSSRRGNKALWAQLLEEARAMARVRHPNLLAVHRFGKTHGMPFFVMEYVAGEDLVAWRNRIPRHLSPDEALGFMQPLCSAVSAIHRAGFLHGDIKPDNVLVGDDGRVRLMDLGLARRTGPEGKKVVGWGGTQDYMPPEVLLDEVNPQYVERVDVYALGILAFQLLTGNDPYPSRGADPVASQLIRGVRLPSEAHPALGTRFDAPLLRALARNPAERTPTPGKLWKELQAAHRTMGSGVQAPRIVVIDDDVEVLAWASASLKEKFGPHAQVHCYASPRAGIDRVAACHPDLVVVDLHMPDMNGLEVVRALRTLPDVARFPILAMTAEGGGSTWRDFQAEGADAFLAKPVVADLFVSTVEWLMERS